VLSLYKNCQYLNVVVDDYIPADANGEVLACVSEDFPFVLWPTILEKVRKGEEIYGILIS
jgi:hypothetical protein